MKTGKEENRWFIEAWDILGGQAYASYRISGEENINQEEPELIEEENTEQVVFLSAPYFEPESIDSLTIADAAVVRGFQDRLFIDKKEQAFETLKEIQEMVKRGYGLGGPSFEPEPEPMDLPPLSSGGEFKDLLKKNSENLQVCARLIGGKDPEPTERLANLIEGQPKPILSEVVRQCEPILREVGVGLFKRQFLQYKYGQISFEQAARIAYFQATWLDSDLDEVLSRLDQSDELYEFINYLDYSRYYFRRFGRPSHFPFGGNGMHLDITANHISLAKIPLLHNEIPKGWPAVKNLQDLLTYTMNDRQWLITNPDPQVMALVLYGALVKSTSMVDMDDKKRDKWDYLKHYLLREAPENVLNSEIEESLQQFASQLGEQSKKTESSR